MFYCVDCQYRGKVFQVEFADCDRGSFTYRAKCPNCSSVKVNVLPGASEDSLRISIVLPSEEVWWQRSESEPNQANGSVSNRCVQK